MTHASAWFEIRKTLEDTPMAGGATSADLDTVTDALVKLLNESLDLRIWVPERPGRYEMATWGGTQFLDGGATVVIRCQDCGPVARRLVPNDTDTNRVQHEITIWADRESGAHTRERHQPEAVPEPAEPEPELERTDCPSCPHARHQGACLVAGQTEGQACLCATRYHPPEAVPELEPDKLKCWACRHPVHRAFQCVDCGEDRCDAQSATDQGVALCGYTEGSGSGLEQCTVPEHPAHRPHTLVVVGRICPKCRHACTGHAAFGCQAQSKDEGAGPVGCTCGLPKATSVAVSVEADKRVAADLDQDPCGWCGHPVFEHWARTGCSHGTCPCGLDRAAARKESMA